MLVNINGGSQDSGEEVSGEGAEYSEEMFCIFNVGRWNWTMGKRWELTKAEICLVRELWEETMEQPGLLTATPVSCAIHHHIGDKRHPCSTLLFGDCLTLQYIPGHFGLLKAGRSVTRNPPMCSHL